MARFFRIQKSRNSKTEGFNSSRPCAAINDLAVRPGNGYGFPSSICYGTMKKANTTATNTVLLLMAGIVWVLVGIMLLVFAFSWLSMVPHVHKALLTGCGIGLALLVHHLGLLKIVDKNVNRITLMNTKQPLFLFIPWKSYLTIGVMITTGVVLRHSAVPKQYLSIAYIGMGLALVLSSVRYFRMFFSAIKR
jgi:hypothetical protein